MYTEKVIEHFKNPHNQGSIKDADTTAIQTNPGCGDTIKLYLNIENNIIKEVKFETMGCAAAIASSSAMTDLVKGKTIEEALAVTKNQIVESLGGLPAPKVHCSLLGVDALHKAIKNYKNNNNNNNNNNIPEGVQVNKNMKIQEKIEKALKSFSPAMKADGGDVEFVNFDEKTGILQVRLLGMCSHCPMSQITLKQGIEVEIRKEVPEVKEVVGV